MTKESLIGGVAEFSGETNWDSYFTTPSGHAGVTFVASTGDSGAPGGYPAFSPNVLAVGGTSLTLGAGNTYGSETAWSGSGGGLSADEVPRPSYQAGVAAVVGNVRGMPDVSFDAAPSSGPAVYDSYDYPGTPWIQVGGTSFSAPSWAALIAIADQGRAGLSLPSLDGPTQTLPLLYSLPAGDFHDVTSGSNGAYSAGPGYDLVTGRGTPIANLLIPDLAGVINAAGPFEVADFSGHGVWRHSARGWLQLNTTDASATAVDANGDVVANFPGQGLSRYENATGWQLLSYSSASLVGIAGSGYIVADFPGQGVWRYENATSWQQLSSSDATLLAIDDNGDIAANFSATGVWRYENATSWHLLSSSNATALGIAGNGYIVAAFSGSGLWRFEDATGWQLRSSSTASAVGIDANGDLVAAFTSGVWRYEDATNWQQLSATQASAVGITGSGNVVADFPTDGIWLYEDSTSWEQIYTTDGSSVGIGG